ncbi:MAG: 4-hydroxy-tetrahydrodipicolinate synthase [Candidatus Parvarchaeum sp.]
MGSGDILQTIHNIHGCITALITPFDNKLEVDYEGFKKNIKFQIENGVTGIVPLGTTGESPTITENEFKDIVSTSVEVVQNKVPVIVGTGSNSTEKTVLTTKKAEELGADAALIITPYYNKPTQEGIYRHFEKISNNTELPIIIYNIASRTGVNIETKTMIRLSNLRNVVGVKEASGNINQIADVIKQLPNDFIVISGDDSMTLPLISLGGHGVISVASNILPRMTSDMVKLALEGEISKARKLNAYMIPIFRDLFIETNPIPVKTAMRMLGMPSGGFRLPLCDMTPQNMEKLRETLSSYEEFKELIIHDKE